MPATTADIAAGGRPAVEVRFETPAMLARYPSARDGSIDPREGFFDSTGDAQTAINAAGALIGVERRRFMVELDGLTPLDPSLGTPTVRLIDAEQAVDGLFLVSRIELDLERERTTLEVFG